MNRLEFMNQLEKLLADIPESEKQEALLYYEDYFNDAGVESEQEVLKSLGSPEKIAQSIKSEIGAGQRPMDSDKIECREHTRQQSETVYQSGTYEGGTHQGGTYQSNRSVKPEEKSRLSGGMIALIVILCICASPIFLGLAGTVLSIVASIIITLFSLIIAFGSISICFFVCGILSMAVGIIKLFASPLGGLVLIGTGLLFGGFALLFMLLTVWLTVTVTPAFFKGLIWLCKAPLKKHA